MSLPDFLLDKRVVRRNIDKRLVLTKQVDSYLKSLPDVEANSEPCLPPEPEADEAGAPAED